MCKSKTIGKQQKQQTERKERGMCKKNNLLVLMLVGALSLAFSQNLFAQCTVCPAGATDSAVAVGLAAFSINPDGTTGPAIRGAVGVCQSIRLRMSVAYSTPGPSGGTTVAFSGGRMVIRSASGTFIQDVTPASGVPKIAPVSEIGPGGCAA